MQRCGFLCRDIFSQITQQINLPGHLGRYEPYNKGSFFNFSNVYLNIAIGWVLSLVESKLATELEICHTAHPSDAVMN